MKIWKIRARKPLTETDLGYVSKTDIEPGKGDVSFSAGDYRVLLSTPELERVIQHHYADHRFAWQISKDEFVILKEIHGMNYAELRAEVVRLRMAERAAT